MPAECGQCVNPLFFFVQVDVVKTENKSFEDEVAERRVTMIRNVRWKRRGRREKEKNLFFVCTCCEPDFLVPYIIFSPQHTDTHIYLLSLALALSIHNKQLGSHFIDS
jgi:hypothetical protein